MLPSRISGQKRNYTKTAPLDREVQRKQFDALVLRGFTKTFAAEHIAQNSKRSAGAILRDVRNHAHQPAKPAYKNNRLLTPLEEEVICVFFEIMAHAGRTIDTGLLRTVADTLLDVRHDARRATKDWVSGFLGRHSGRLERYATRSKKEIAMKRLDPGKKERCKRFCASLGKLLDGTYFTHDTVFNIDEVYDSVDVVADDSQRLCLAYEGAPAPIARSGKERWHLCTSIVTTCRDGSVPLVGYIFQSSEIDGVAFRKWPSDLFVDDLSGSNIPAKRVFVVTKTETLTKDLWLSYLNHLCDVLIARDGPGASLHGNARPMTWNLPRASLVLVDNVSSHALAALDELPQMDVLACRQLILHSLPSNSTETLQPNDQEVFASFKPELGRVLRSLHHRAELDGTIDLTKPDSEFLSVPMAVKAMFEVENRCWTKEVVQKAWERTHLFPFEPAIVNLLIAKLVNPHHVADVVKSSVKMGIRRDAEKLLGSIANPIAADAKKHSSRRTGSVEFTTADFKKRLGDTYLETLKRRQPKKKRKVATGVDEKSAMAEFLCANMSARTMNKFKKR